MWNLNKETRKQTKNPETDSQTDRTNWWLPMGRDVEDDE